MNEILIVGRGPSVCDFDWSSVSMPIMAVSSGIFAVPDGVQVDHFVTMDPLKFYMAGLSESAMAWSADENVTHHAFWRDPNIIKHVLSTRLDIGKYRTLPEEIWDAIPDRHLRSFQKALTNTLHAFGFQPSWGDCLNCRGWDVAVEEPPNIGGSGTRLGIEGVRNSWLMAVQIASLLGFRRLLFVGCDFLPDYYSQIMPTIERWHGLFAEAGFEWITLAPHSRLAEFMPVMPDEQRKAQVFMQDRSHFKKIGQMIDRIAASRSSVA